jgi:SOUL heme-binding protein
MKMLILVVVTLILLLVIFQSFVIMSTNKTAGQPYTVIAQKEGFEIRFYPAATIASIQSNASTYKELSAPGFRKLAGYIFGGNQTAEKIAMTSPVHMDIANPVSTMSFVMPEGYNAANLPTPNDPSVVISTTKEEFVAAIKFEGFASDKDLAQYAGRLRELLKENNITHYGHFRYLGYSPPYQLTGRRNEVVVSIHWDHK